MRMENKSELTRRCRRRLDEKAAAVRSPRQNSPRHCLLPACYRWLERLGLANNNNNNNNGQRGETGGRAHSKRFRLWWQQRSRLPAPAAIMPFIDRGRKGRFSSTSLSESLSSGRSKSESSSFTAGDRVHQTKALWDCVTRDRVAGRLTGAPHQIFLLLSQFLLHHPHLVFGLLQWNEQTSRM